MGSGRYRSSNPGQIERQNMAANYTGLRKTNHNLFIFGWLLIWFLVGLAVVPDFAIAGDANSIEITGEGVAQPLTLSIDQLEAMEQYEHVYSVINTCRPSAGIRPEGC